MFVPVMSVPPHFPVDVIAGGHMCGGKARGWAERERSRRQVVSLHAEVVPQVPAGAYASGRPPAPLHFFRAVVMTNDKLELRLRREITSARAAEQGDRLIPVIIEHVEIGVVSNGDPRDGLANLEARVEHLQKGIVEQLEEFGAPDIQQSILANLIGVSLRARQIQVVAAREDVKSIRLNREDGVTC
jgi:hypothetical protein